MEKLRDRMAEENRTRALVSRQMQRAMRMKSEAAQAAVSDPKLSEELMRDPDTAREVEEGFAELQQSSKLPPAAVMWLEV
jgi:hypothetical protein